MKMLIEDGKRSNTAVEISTASKRKRVNDKGMKSPCLDPGQKKRV